MRPPPFVICLLLCALLGWSAGCSKPKGTPLGSAQLFFDQIHRGETGPAFESSAFSFREQQNLKFFIERIREYNLQDAAVALSPLPGDAGDTKTAKFSVEVSKKDGKKYTLILTMELDKETWRVLSLRAPRDRATGISENRFSIVGRPASLNYAANKKVPDDDTVRQMVNRSMLLFSDAVQTETFWEFYENTSVAWQKELTEQKLENAFHSFIDRKVNMTGIMDMQPKFDAPPEIGTDGYLSVAGYYPTKPYEVHFSLRYIYELPEWKLLGLNCYLKKVGEEEKPPVLRVAP